MREDLGDAADAVIVGAVLQAWSTRLRSRVGGEAASAIEAMRLATAPTFSASRRPAPRVTGHAAGGKRSTSTRAPRLARVMPRAAAAPRPPLRWRVRPGPFLFALKSGTRAKRNSGDVLHPGGHRPEFPGTAATLGGAVQAREFPSLPLWEDGSEGNDRYPTDERSGGRSGAAARGMTRAGRTTLER